MLTGFSDTAPNITIIIEDNRVNPRKPLEELAFFKKNYSLIIKDANALQQAGSNLIEEIKTINPNLQAYTFINRADANGQDNDDAAGLLDETTVLTFIDVLLGTRKAFGNGAASGLSVVELKPKDTKAIAEIETLFQYIFNVK